MSQPTLWERVKVGGKSGFDRAYKVVDKLGPPVNKLSNKLGSEAFWPTTLDKESDKAARILKTFCKDGFYTEEEFQPEDGPKQKQKVVKKIPAEVIQNAKGLAIFTTMRTGLWVSGAGGSGVLIARKQDGSWSSPSGIMLHTAGLGFLVGVDIYDCVVVINSEEALEAFSHIRCTLGSEMSVVAGPLGVGGVLESEVHKRQAPVFTYLKSRGFYAGVQIDGTVIIERTDENERFYGERVPVADILAGKVRHPPYEVRKLLETVRAAQGDTDIDESMLPTEPPPSDYVIEDSQLFGIPDKEDPDPYGVLALEKEGMSIKEAGTQKRASWEVFSFNPSPTSPVHNMYSRTGPEKRASLTRRSSWRVSAFSNEPKTPTSLRSSMELPPALPPRRPSSLMVDTSTQTDDLPETMSPDRPTMSNGVSHHRGLSRSSSHIMQEVPEDKVLDTTPELEQSEIDTGHVNKVNGYTTPPRTPSLDDKRPDIDEKVHTEEPVVHSVQTIQSASPQVISKARLVDVPKRVPPRLPPRHHHRSGPIVIDASPKDTPAEDTVSVDSKHDSAHESSTQKDIQVEQAKERIRDDHLDDEEDAEMMKTNPWAKVEETRKRESEQLPTMPGGFVQ